MEQYLEVCRITKLYMHFLRFCPWIRCICERSAEEQNDAIRIRLQLGFGVSVKQPLTLRLLIDSILSAVSSASPFKMPL